MPILQIFRLPGASFPFPAQGVAPLLLGKVTSLAFDEAGERLLSGNDEGQIILIFN